MAGFGFEADASAHAFEALADEGEADACAGIRIGGMESLEKAEDFLMVLRGDPNASVCHPDAQGRIFALSPDFNLRVSISGNKFEAVGNKIVKYLADGCRVRLD